MKEKARSTDISRMIAEGGLGADAYYESEKLKKKESSLVSHVPSEQKVESSSSE